ncbi:MAG: hypothetical protein V8Q30_10375 [Acutalibacteraceae bacterium]
MGVTLQEMGSGLEVYAAQADKPGFIEDMIGEIGELKAAGVTPDRLFGLALPGNPSLTEKIGDIASIYAAYQALIDRSYLDGEDDLIRAVQMLSPREFFGGVSVFIDSFTAFMEAEYQMLGAMLAGASDVTAAFTCDGLDDPDQGLGVFSASKESAARLVQMAGDSAVPVAEPILMGEPLRFQSEGLRRVEQYFLRPTAGGEPSGEGVTLVRAADPYEEIAAVAASICEDVRRRGLRYKEIAVICRDLAPYRIALERTFGKYGIPFFADLPQGRRILRRYRQCGRRWTVPPRALRRGISCGLPRRQPWVSTPKPPLSWKTTAMCGMWAAGTGRSPLRTIRGASRRSFRLRTPPVWSASMGCAAG